jgi:hypothetical protein
MWWRRVRYVLVLTALCAVATCPAAKRACTADVRAREAETLLDYLADRVAEGVAATGKVPPVAAGPTPVPGCCEQGGTCAADAISWDAPGWRALRFSIDGDFRFSYQYEPDSSGASAILRATGDLGCDGTTRIDELHVSVDSDGKSVTRTWSHRVVHPDVDSDDQ